MVYRFTYQPAHQVPAHAQALASMQGGFKQDALQRIERNKPSIGDYERLGIRVRKQELLTLLKLNCFGQWGTMRFNGETLEHKHKRGFTKLYPKAIGIMQELQTGDTVVIDLTSTSSQDTIPYLSAI